MVAILFTCILCWIWLQILISELVSSAFNGINSIEYFGLKKYTCFYKQTKQIHNNGQQPTHPLNGTAPGTIYTGTQNVQIVNIHKISSAETLFSCILSHVVFQNGLVSCTCYKSAISQNIWN